LRVFVLFVCSFLFDVLGDHAPTKIIIIIIIIEEEEAVGRIEEIHQNRLHVQPEGTCTRASLGGNPRCNAELQIGA
jgi:hypothetical protein